MAKSGVKRKRKKNTMADGVCATTGRRSSDYNTMLTAIKEIGANLEVYHMYVRAGQEASPSKTLNQVESAEIRLGPGAEEDIGALLWEEKKKGKGKGNVPP